MPRLEVALPREIPALLLDMCSDNSHSPHVAEVAYHEEVQSHFLGSQGDSGTVFQWVSHRNMRMQSCAHMKTSASQRKKEVTVIIRHATRKEELDQWQVPYIPVIPCPQSAAGLA